MNNLSTAEVAEENRVLKEAPSKVIVWDKCKGMNTGYGFDGVENNEVIYKSPLEDGFIPVEEAE